MNNVFVIIFFSVMIGGLSFLCIWNVYKIIKTIIARKKSKNNVVDEDINKHESKRKDK